MVARLLVQALAVVAEAWPGASYRPRKPKRPPSCTAIARADRRGQSAAIVIMLDINARASWGSMIREWEEAMDNREAHRGRASCDTARPPR
jgi:hypothetical protein